MKCNQCGTEMPDQAAFCPKCGAQAGSSAGKGPAPAARLQPAVAQGSARDVPEEELWSGSYSPKAMTGWYIVVLVLAIVGFIFGSQVHPNAWIVVAVATLAVFILMSLYSLYKKMTVHYQLTTHRFVIQEGLLSRTDNRILLVDVDDITVKQGMVERMFNLGTIILRTTDETTKEQNPDKDAPGTGIVRMEGIENPRQVGDMIDESRRSERTRRGVYMMNA